MQVHFVGKQVSLSDDDKAYAEKKVRRLTRFLRNLREAHLTHTEQRGLHRVEVVVDADGVLLRAEERDHSVRAAIDLAIEKVERQVRRFKGRLLDRWHDASPASGIEQAAMLDEPGEIEETLPSIIRTKRFLLKPMTADEAALQMELLDHQFFAFLDADRDAISVAYRRKDGNYAVLELEV